MSLNSVQTNMGAMVALQSLNRTNEQMATTQKAISTGFRVADAKDDGAAYSVAQRVRSDVGALSTANTQLKGVKGTLDTTLGALDQVASVMKDMRSLIVNLANADTQGQTRANYKQAYADKLQSVKDFIADAAKNSNGKALIDGSGTTPSNYGDVSVVRNEVGDALTISAVDLTAQITAISYSDADLDSAATMQTQLASAGTFRAAEDAVSKAANSFGTKSKYIDNQIKYNETKIDAMNGGLGALIDADLSKEAANLQALQVRQQLGTQALSMANQSPQSLLSLFR